MAAIETGNNKYILDDNGEPVPCADMKEWGDFYENGREKWHLQNELRGVRISTVFLGLDHGFGMGKPVLWETMIFGGPEDQGQWRHYTYDEAKEFHAKKLQKYTGVE